MKLSALSLDGVFAISSPTFSDVRGSFLRVWDNEVLIAYLDLKQASAAINPIARTLRGLHFQNKPYEETKIVECISGSIFDVIVDLRDDSVTFEKYISIIIGPKEQYQGLLIPKGFAHGYLTLEANSTILYFMDSPYVPESSKGVVWNDLSLGIEWPFEPEVMSDRDQSFPSLKDL